MPTTWYDAKKGPQYPPLKGSKRTEILVIGGGLAGVWTAYLLSENHDVTLIEADSLGVGATIDTTAFITEIIDTDATELIKSLSKDKTAPVYTSHSQAIRAIAKTIDDEQIDCEFSWATAYVFAAEMDQYPLIEGEFEALESVGVQAFMHTTHDLEFVNYGHYEVKNQAKYHPLKFLSGLAAAASRLGAQIHEQTEAKEISRSNGTVIAKGQRFQVEADWVIVCTYSPFNKPSEVFAKKGMYKSYVLEAELPAGRLMPGLYWDKHNPYNYFRIDSMRGFDRIILGGQDHRYELPVDREERFQLLENYLKKLLPETGYKIRQQWAGPILEPSDGLPLIGQYQERQLLAAGFSGNGMTYSPIAAMIFRDIIEGRPNDWISLYDPDRTLKPYQLLQKGTDYAEEFFNGVIKNFFK